MRNSTLSKLISNAKPLWRPIARASFCKLRPSALRLAGSLAKDGGRPVRDLRLRPWASVNDGNLLRWHFEARGAFRRIYTAGVEGLPQPQADRFAELWASYCGCRYGLLLMHGTDAIRFGLAAALDHDGLEYGGEVIVPNFSFIASASAPLDRRFGVVFVDVDPTTLLIDPNCVEQAIIPGKTRAIIPVHLFGQPADMTALRAIADKHGLKIIEDAAQAHGAMFANRRVGSFGDGGAFSFQSSKNLACGEGGALVTNDEQLFRRAYSLHNVGRSRTGKERWQHDTLGWNCRLTEYQAALLIHRFKMFERLQATRAQNFGVLRRLMESISSLEPLVVHPNVQAHGMYMFVMRYKSERCGGLSIDRFLEYVQSEGVPVYRAFDATLSDQPAIKDLAAKHPRYFRSLATPVANEAAKDTVYIPQEIFLGTGRDMEDIVAAVNKVERNFSKRTSQHRSNK